MATRISTHQILFLSLFSLAIVQPTLASDPDITSDFVPPLNLTDLTENFFTFTSMRGLKRSPPTTNFRASKASMVEFPALSGQSVSYAVLEFPAGTTNPPHTHPRSAELLFLLYGSLQVGFVDTSNKLFAQTLQEGDKFVFPKGLVHFQYNSDSVKPAVAVSAFGSANAGTVSLPNTLFTTGIDDMILAKSFNTSVDTIQALKAGLMAKA